MTKKKNPSLVVAITRGIVRDQRARRTVLFFVVLGAMGMLFVGSVVIPKFLELRPLVFLGWWGACLWLTVLSLLLALFDLLMLRKAARQERRELRKEIFKDGEEES